MLWGDMWKYLVETFTEDEVRILSRYFTNVDKPVFALINLPEVVKGALFARYSRSSKSLRRLFLDEFYEDVVARSERVEETGIKRAESLYERMLADYGDDSVAQLGGVHLACEQASNILTKVLERGRLMAYLEQSTRYVPYDKLLPDGSYKYYVPDEIFDSGVLKRYTESVDSMFSTYSNLLGILEERVRHSIPKDPNDSDFVYRTSTRAVALDAVRGLLPASVLSNVGIFASAQAYEGLVLRMRASDLTEVRRYGEMIKEELDKVIPAFLTRLDRPDRGGAWVKYLQGRRQMEPGVSPSLERATDLKHAGSTDEVTVRLLDFDPRGEQKIAAAILFENSRLPMDHALEYAAGLSVTELQELFERYVGVRENRRHKPGRAFEATDYLFEIEADYGAFRDLQRHRILSIEWQDLGVDLGYVVSELIREFDLEGEFDRVMGMASELHDELKAVVGPRVSSYGVPMAYRIRFTIRLNAREAMHLIELRSMSQGHTTYRRVAQRMYESIVNTAQHKNIGSAMNFVDMDHYRLGRLSSLRETEKKIGRLPR